jgi:alpha-beta hydrolase superfamily lysophospholipase
MDNDIKFPERINKLDVEHINPPDIERSDYDKALSRVCFGVGLGGALCILGLINEENMFTGVFLLALCLGISYLTFDDVRKDY